MRAETEVLQWLLPWTKTLRLVFYDANECGMKTTYEHLEAGAAEAAMVAARSSVAECDEAEAEAKFRAAAHYNLGMLLFVNGDYEAALRLFDEAGAIDGENDAIQTAKYETMQAQQLAARLSDLGLSVPD